MTQIINLVDEERLQYLKNRMGEKFPVLIESYIRDGKKYSDSIGEGLFSGDIDTVIAAAHTLKSSSGTLGLPKVRETAEKIEYKAKELKKDGRNSTDEIALLYPELKNEFDLTIGLLTDFKP